MAYTLKEAVELLDSNEWLSIRFITANVHKGSGGEVKEFAKCKSHPNTGHNPYFIRNVELPSKKLRAVHPILITHINNIPVL